MRILLVEDERKVAKALQEGLEGESYSVVVAHTGEEGFFLLNSEQFDLLVLDISIGSSSCLFACQASELAAVAPPCLPSVGF